MQVKGGCFTRNLMWLWFFPGPVLQTSCWFHRFVIFGFYYFSDDPPLENYGGKLNYEKDKQDKYSVNE